MENSIKRRFFPGLSGSTLKLIAIILMVIDHIGAAILEKGILLNPAYQGNPELYNQILDIDRILRTLGRPSFPIFCFLLIEGFLHTRNQKNYASRLFLFALISEIPFDLAIFGQLWYPGAQNIFFTLLIGLLVMMAIERYGGKIWVKGVFLLLGLLAGYLLKTDYGCKGVLLIEVLYLLRFDRRIQALGGALTISWELAGPLGFIPVWFYNGKRGFSMKYFFYWFYPVHLLLFTAIRFLIT